MSDADTLTSMPFSGRSCESPSISLSRTLTLPVMVHTLALPPPPLLLLPAVSPPGTSGIDFMRTNLR